MTEGNAQVIVAAVWGTEFIPVLAALAILPSTILKNRMKHPFLQIILVQLFQFFNPSSTKQLARQGTE